jgi:hypothetical protein
VRWNQVREWRNRAEVLRRTAEDFGLPSARDGLIEAAESYERMADEMERKLKTLAGGIGRGALIPTFW